MMDSEYFVQEVRKFVGNPYWYGTCVYDCTESLLKSKTRQYPQHYTSSRMSRYREDIAAKRVCADCVGMIKGIAWENGFDKDVVPDKSANGMFDYAKKCGMDWGTISTIPDVAGIAVRYDGHVGVYVGDGEVVEERGFNYGCVRTKLKDRKWTHWYKLPWIEYDADAPVEEKPCVLGDRLLKRGCKGADVAEMQTQLAILGYDLSVDGEFGEDTQAVVMQFQDAYGLEADGLYGEKTHNALMVAVQELQADEDADENPSTDTDAMFVVRVTGSRVNIREGNGTQYPVVTVASRDDLLTAIARSWNGWYAVEVNGRIGWISGKYAGWSR